MKRLAPWLLALALVAANVFVFEQVRGHGFVSWDDEAYIAKDPHVSAGLTANGIAWAWTTATPPYWYPVTLMSHMLDVDMFGLRPGGHHLTSLALHTINTLLLFLFLFGATGFPGRSAFVAALFAVHPLHVESVAWLAERKDVLSTTFLLLTFLAYRRYTRTPSVAGYALVALMFGAGLASKPMLVSAPVLLLLLDVWPLRRWVNAGDARRLIVEKLPLVAMSIAAAVVTFVVQQRVGAVSKLGALPIGTRLANALVSCAKYLVMMVWPHGLAGLYPYPRDIAPVWLLAAVAAGLIAISVWSFRSLRNAPYVFVGWWWYLVTLAPVIGVVQVGEQAMADRFTYVPLIGIFIIVSWLIGEMLSRIPAGLTAAPVVSTAVVVMLAVAARQQVTYWKDSHALWERAIAATRDNYYAHTALGAVLADEGKIDAARAHEIEALRIRPWDAEAHNELGRILAQQGDVDGAIEHFKAALATNPDFAQARHNLSTAENARARSRYNNAVTLAARGELDQAILEYRAVIDIAPDLPEARNNLALALEATGKAADAEDVFKTALERWPDRLDLNYNLALLYARQRNTKSAAEYLQRVLRIDPRHEQAAKLLKMLPR